jgi:hypothetical protein
MPIAEAMNRILNEDAAIDGELRKLLERPLREE